MTSANTSSLPPHTRRRFSWLLVLRVLALLWTAIVIEQDVETLISYDRKMPYAGSLGWGLSLTPPLSPGFVDVVAVTPGGPFDRAGIKNGDRVGFDHTYDYTRRLRIGESVGLTVDHLGVRRHIVVTTVAPPLNPDPWAFITYDQGVALGNTVIALFGAFIVWRSRGRPTTLLLGSALGAYGLANSLPQLSLGAPDIFPWALAGGVGDYALIPILFHAFALRFYHDTLRPPKGWEYILLGIYAVLQAVSSTLFFIFLITLRTWPVIGTGYSLSTTVFFAGLVIAFAYLFLGWWRSRREAQQRYALMLVAISAILLAQAIALTSSVASTLPHDAIVVANIATAILAGIIAPPAFAYAILRHKALDLGFAINRTLVYGVVSAVLLVAFGIAEWAVEHFLPFESREAGVLIDAGIALAVFLVFHRVRDFVEHHVETLFFHQWHRKEEALRRFVREASFILRREPLITAYAAALRAFCEGAEVALYLADRDGAFRLAEGGLDGQPAVLDADASFMVTLRANRAAFEPGTAIALVLPMIHRSEVTGVTLLGPKSSGFGYRPDEKEVLAYAAHQVGLDLHALEVEHLQQANAEMSAKYNNLRDLTRDLLRDATQA